MNAHWGSVRILSEGGQAGKVTELKQYMTWVGGEAFRSGFYYPHIQTDEVDLTFDIEGNEPMMIRSISVHAHPDTIFRLFENGMVLANPSRSPYEFDVARLSPGSRPAKPIVVFSARRIRTRKPITENRWENA